jgi:nucleoside-diphosphate-sugar epimerase
MAPGWFDEESIALNDRMLRNIFEPLRAVATGLQHVSLMQGSKAYGMHNPELLDRIRAPLRESEPRLEHPNFYFVQQDYLSDLAAASDWDLTVWRPTVIYGDAPGVNMNVIRAIAVYAALERERGDALAYPGGTYDQSFQEAIDSDLLGQALVWAATSPGARDRVFNITNGDTFTWRHSWGVVADAFGMTPGEHRPMSFAEDLPRRDDEWADLVSRHGLDAPSSIVEHVGANSLLYADWMLGSMEGVAAPLNSTIAIRQAGFHGCVDTEEMFARWFHRVQDEGVVPRPRAS